MASVEIYTKSWCGFCQAAKRLLAQKGVSFTEYDVEKDRARLPEVIGREEAAVVMGSATFQCGGWVIRRW